MGFFNTLTEWSAARREKRSAEMRSQGKCPDCYGRGLYPLINEFFYPLECTSCNGTGLLAFGSEVNQTKIDP